MTAPFNEMFPHRAYINLDRRVDRRQRVTARFRAAGLMPVTRFAAVDALRTRPPRRWPYSAGAYACLRSHLTVLRHAREHGWPRVLIFEDDTVLADGFLQRFAAARLPVEWDMLHLGGLHGEDPIAIGGGLARLRQTRSTFAYALNHTVYDAFIDLNTRACQPVDENNTLLQRRFNCFGFHPPLAWVEADYSDAQERAVNPWWLRHGLALRGQGMARLFGRTAVVLAHRAGAGSAHLPALIARNYPPESGVAVAVVEMGRAPAIYSPPPGCLYRFLPTDGSFDAGACYNLGIDSLGGDRDYYLFADSTVWPGPEARACLGMCAQTGFVGSFEAIYALDGRASRRLVATGRADAGGRPPERPANGCAAFCVFSAATIAALGGWPEGPDGRAESRQAARLKRRDLAYRSPGAAFRVHTGSGVGAA